jgi:integrase
MSRPKSLKPAYCLHKPSGRAYVTLDGKQVNLGQHDTQESRDRYDMLIAEWIKRGRTPVASEASEPTSGLTVSQLIAAFWEHCQTYYRLPDGTPTSEVENFRQALRPLRRLYGGTPAGKFGPLALKVVREAMMSPTVETDPSTGKRTERPGWSRKNLNKQISRIRQLFKWGVEEERIPVTIYQALLAVKDLKAGRSKARETQPVRPVADDILAKTLPHLSQTIRDMVHLQLVTGMRPGELCAMRGKDIDTTGTLWLYKPAQHKTQHHEHERTVYMGQRAKEIVSRYLKASIEACLFSPAEAEADRREKQHEARVNGGTPLSCGNKPGTNRRKEPKHKPGERYDVSAYRRAISRGADKADLWEKGGRVCGNDERLIPRWHPHQLRHNAGTLLRKEYGLEAAQVVLGHKTLTVTQVYAEKNVEAAQKIMLKIG